MKITFQFVVPRLKRLLLKPLIILLVVTGFAVYLYYDTHQQLNQLAQYIAQPLRFTQVSYEKLSLSSNGSITLHQLRAYHLVIKDPHIDHHTKTDSSPQPVSDYREFFLFDSFAIVGRNIFALLNMNNSLRYQKWPKSLHIEATTFYTRWFQSLAVWSPQQTLHSFATLLTSCGIHEESETLSYASYLASENPPTHVKMHYHFNEMNNSLAISATIALKDFLSINATAHFLVSPDILDFHKAATAPLKLVSFNMIYKDQRYNDQRQQWCKKRYGIDKEAFIITQSSQFIETFQALGMTPSIDIMSGYQRHLADQESLILFTATPIQPLDLKELSAHQPGRLWNALQPRLTINNELITDLSVAFHEPIIRPKERFKLIASTQNPLTPPADVSASVEPHSLESPSSLESPTSFEAVSSKAASSEVPTPSDEKPVNHTDAVNPLEQLMDHAFDHAAPSPWLTVRSPHQEPSGEPPPNPSTSSTSITPSHLSLPNKLDRPGYRPVTRYELARCIDRKILVQMLNGKEHIGKLTHLAGDTLTLSLDMQGGSVVFFLHLDKISEIHVADR